MQKQELQQITYNYLDNMFPTAQCELNFDNNLQLLVAVILSAQCTDKRVNQVTQNLFLKYQSVQDFANANILDLEKAIFSCGFYHNKAKNIKSACNDIIDRFNGQVPDNFEDLISLNGVGRKTANVVLAVGFHKDTIAVDTHVFRVSNRLGLAKANNALKCEMQLQKIVPKEQWSRFHHLLVLFGRYHCKAIKPNCAECKLKDFCKFYKQKNSSTMQK